MLGAGVGRNLALVNAQIHTMHPAQPTAEAAIVLGGRIRLVGTTTEVRDAARAWPAPVDEFDCAGRTVVPGFIDGHTHLELTCVALTHCLSLTVPPYGSLEEMGAAIAQRAERTPPGEWIIARTGFGLQAKVPEARLFTRHDLDAISEQHPIVVFASLHVGMLNTPALRATGLWERAADPPMGTLVHREESGAPTGVVVEMWDMLPAFPRELVVDGLRAKAHELFLANGVTTVHTLPYAADDIRAVRDTQASGDLPLRARFYIHAPHQMSLEQLLALGIQPGFGDDMLRYGGVKTFIDGTCHDGYGNRTWDVKWTPEDLNDFVERAHAGGQQLWMHINSVRSLRMGMDAIERAILRHPAPHRHRLEHAADFVAEPDDMLRLRALGIGVVTTPQFIYSQADTASKREPRPYRLRTILDHGLQPIGSSDSTGTVPDGIAPLFNIACAVNRRTQFGRTYLPEERVLAEEALRMFTTWPAYWAYEERDKGAIAPGMLGDFAVLTADPLAVEPEALYDLRVQATVVGGEVVYES